MKFETKLNKLGINEEEVKSIIANCECGEINGAYFIDLTKEKKEFIMEVVGNYLDDDSEELEGWTDIKRISTFCKVFGISEDEITDYYRLGFNEGGEDIAYTLESNKDVLLVLTDDERYTNSFIQYSSSQQEEKSVEELTAEYDATIDELTRLDDETNLDEICIDKYLMQEYESKKETIENKLDELSEQIDKAQDKEESEMDEEKIVEFKLVSKEDNRIYLNGTFDVASYDEDTCDGDWEYEQNDGSFSSHLPSYWKVNGENLSFEYDQFLDNIDWESFRQHLFNFKDTDKSIDCGDYILHINYGALLHLIIKKDEDFEENFIATLNFNYNEEPVEFEEDILRDLAELLNFNDNMGWLSDINTSSITLTIPKSFSEYIEEDYEGYNEEIIDEWLESFGKMYSQQLVRYAGIRWNYGEGMEEALEDGLASDNEEMFEFICAIDEDELIERFLINHNYIEE